MLEKLENARKVLQCYKWSPSVHQKDTKWSPSSHQKVTKWTPKGHQVVTKRSTSGRFFWCDLRTFLSFLANLVALESTEHSVEFRINKATRLALRAFLTLFVDFLGFVDLFLETFKRDVPLPSRYSWLCRAQWFWRPARRDIPIVPISSISKSFLTRFSFSCQIMEAVFSNFAERKQGQYFPPMTVWLKKAWENFKRC